MRRSAWWLAALALAVVPNVSSAAPITFDYNFVGGPGANPGPFTPTGGGPTITASTAGIPLLAAAQVYQSSFGLGVRSNGLFLGIIPFNTEGVGGAGATQGKLVDGFTSGGLLNAVPETLTLTYTNTSPFVTDERLTQITFSGLAPNGSADDFALLINGNLQGTYNFNVPGGVVTFDTPIALSSGDQIGLLPLVPLNLNQNQFAVSALQIQATPEPATLAAFGLIGAAGFGYIRRRVKGVPIA